MAVLVVAVVELGFFVGELGDVATTVVVWEEFVDLELELELERESDEFEFELELERELELDFEFELDLLELEFELASDTPSATGVDFFR